MSLLRFANTTDLKRAVKDPQKALRTVHRSITTAESTAVKDSETYDSKRASVFSSHLSIDPDYVTDVLDEFRSSRFQERIDQCRSEMDAHPFNLGGMTAGSETAYVAARIVQPQTVLEIGVANGVSTTYLLAAADHGSFSPDIRAIDKPLFESDVREQRGKRGLKGVGGIIPNARDAGWVAPKADRARHGHQYYVGDFNEILPSVLETQEDLELALYDASKDASEMRFAYEHIIGTLASGGVLISDDINVNSVFSEVCAQSDGESAVFGGCGVFIKD